MIRLRLHQTFMIVGRISLIHICRWMVRRIMRGNRSQNGLLLIWANEGRDDPLAVGGDSVVREGAYFLEGPYEYAQDESVHLINEALRKAGFNTVIIG